MSWRFSPPVRGYGPSFRADADRVTTALWSHFRGAPEPRSVLKVGATYTEQGYVYSDDIDSADVFYQGGHIYEVDDTEAAALIAAGYEVVDASDLLSEAVALYRASSIDPDTFTDGDDWPNEGTAGASYDAQAATVDDNPGNSGPPHFVTAPSPGFEITAAAVSYYYVPDGAAIKPGTGSFTAFGKFYRPSGSGVFDNGFAKINTDGGAMGSGGYGWQIADGSALGNNVFAIIAAGGPAAYAVFPGNLTAGEHLVVMRVDRDTDLIDVFVDGVKGTPADASSVPDVTAAHEWIFGRGTTQTNRDYGLFMRALTDLEITTGLRLALED